MARLNLCFFIGSAMLICGNIAVNVIPIVIGQLIEDHPLVLMYILASTTISYSLLFVVAIFTGRNIEQKLRSSVTNSWNYELDLEK